MSKLAHEGVRDHRRAVVSRLHPRGCVGVTKRVGRYLLFDFRTLHGRRQAPAHVGEHPTIERGEEQVGGSAWVLLQTR